MNLEKDVVIIGVKYVSFTNDEKESVTGTQVFYHEVDQSSTETELGFIPVKAWIPSGSEFTFYKNAKFPLKAKVLLDIDLQKGKLKAKGFKF